MCQGHSVWCNYGDIMYPIVIGNHGNSNLLFIQTIVLFESTNDDVHQHINKYCIVILTFL